MRLRATRISSLRQSPIVAGLALDRLNAAAAYSTRRLRTAYAGSAVRVRRSSDNVEADIGFTSAGDLDLDALTAHCLAPRRPLTSLSATAAAAYSLRLLRTAYTGPAVRVRRSNDNSEQDIGFNSDGTLDTTALTTFVGANSAFVTTWYDQSGYGRHATQATAAHQPRIVNAGTIDTIGGRPAVRYIRLNGTVLVTPALPFVVARQFLVSSVVQLANLTTSFGRIWVAQNNTFAQGYLGTDSGGGNFLSLAGGSTLTTPVVTATTSPTVITQAFGTAGLAADVNGIRANGGTEATLTAQTGTLSSGTVAIGNNGVSNSEGFEGSIAEIIFLAGAVSASDRTTFEQSQAAYYGVTYAATIPSGFAVTWYDQSGNARNLGQATAANQPRVVNAGVVETDGGRPTMRFDGIDDFLLGASNIGLTGNPLFTLSLVSTATLPSAQVFVSFGAAGAGQGFHYMGANSGNGAWFGYANSVQLGTVALLSPASPFVMSLVRSGATAADWSVRQNGAALTVTTGNNNPVALVDGPINIGRWVGNTSFAAMRCAEVIVHASALSAADRQLLERNQGAYFGVAVA